MNFKSVAFHHFGCKVNFSEASSLARSLQEKGLEIKNFHEPADVYVINTCVVTAVAEKKCRAAIRQAHKLNPGAKIAVIGCFSELKPDEIRQMKEVDLVLGSNSKFSLVEELAKLAESSHTEDYPGCSPGSTGFHEKQFIPSYSSGDRTRSFLKIQDGCDYFCSYCTIPLARGRSRSDTISHVLTSIGEIAGKGIREIVLTGVNIGDFGRNNGETLFQLLLEINKIKEIERFRISSIEPDLLTDEIIELIAGSINILPHFHIPLQSGSNKILSAMHRKYTRELYQSRIFKIRSMIPHACIAADVIVGFPGEDGEDFNETFEFLANLEISYLHVFSYSRRERTLASKSDAEIPEKVKKFRSDALHQLSEKKKESFYHSNTGRIVKILFESSDNKGIMYGFSENYIKVKTAYNSDLANQVITMKLEKRDQDGLFVYNPNV